MLWTYPSCGLASSFIPTTIRNQCIYRLLQHAKSRNRNQYQPQVPYTITMHIKCTNLIVNCKVLIIGKSMLQQIIVSYKWTHLQSFICPYIPLSSCSFVILHPLLEVGERSVHRGVCSRYIPMLTTHKGIVATFDTVVLYNVHLCTDWCHTNEL